MVVLTAMIAVKGYKPKSAKGRHMGTKFGGNRVQASRDLSQYSHIGLTLLNFSRNELWQHA